MNIATPNIQTDTSALNQQAVFVVSQTMHDVEKKNRYVFAKRVFDIAISSILIVSVLSWLYPVLYVLIKSGSKGKALFIQKRTGLYGQTFNCLKFRTIFVNEESDTKDTAENDKRITRIGKWLRKSYIDELPQLINVLRGEMSMVGPRPHMLLHNKKFGFLIINYNERHKVKPGITGLAQVEGYHGFIPDNHSIYARTRLDLFYIKKVSFLLDIKILLKTVSVIFFPKSFHRDR